MAGQERRHIDFRLIAVAGLLCVGGKLLCQMAAAAILRKILGGPDHLGIGRAIPEFRSGWLCIFLGRGPAEYDDGRDQNQHKQDRDSDFMGSAGHCVCSGKLRPALPCANTDVPDANRA